MTKQIWVPEILYKKLPKAAAMVGITGLIFLSGSYGWTLVSGGTALYGAAIMGTRILHGGV